MKLTNRTTPQARSYQCDICKSIRCHKEMHDDDECYDCWEQIERDKADEEKKRLGELK